jgi:hypothetical protein
MKEQDRELAFAFDDHRRATATVKLARICSLGLLSEEEFGSFSEETREIVLDLTGGP